MTPKCPDCKRDQDECICKDEIASLRAENEALKEQLAKAQNSDQHNFDRWQSLKQQVEQGKLDAVPEWISVEDRLPEDGLYMAWVTDKTNKFGGLRMILEYGEFSFCDDIYAQEPQPDADEDGWIIRYGWSYERDSEGEYDYLRFDMNGKVTHWMPLPAAPKQEK